MRKLFLNLSIIGAFLALFSICYFSVLTHEYGFVDDYYDSIPENQDWVVIKRFLEGRPLYALVSKFSLPVADIEHLHYVRFVGIVGISLFAFVMFKALRHAGINAGPSFYISIILGTTPGIQVYAAWATTFVFPFAGALAGCGLLLAEQGFESRSRVAKWWSACMGVLVLVAALAIYQPAAMLFWCAAAAFLFGPGRSFNDMRARLLWYSLIGMVAMLLGWAVYELTQTFYPGYPQRTSLGWSFWEKASFLYESFPVTSAGPFLSPSDSFYSRQWQEESIFYPPGFDDFPVRCLLFLFMITGLGLHLRGGRTERLLKWSIVPALWIFVLVPFLVLERIEPDHRILVAPTSLMVLYYYFALQGWCRLCPSFINVRSSLTSVALGSLAGACLFVAGYQVRYWMVVPQVRELEIMRYPLTPENLAEAEWIFVIRPAHFWSETFAPFIWGEFGPPSSRHHSSSMISYLVKDSRPPQVISVSAGRSRLDPLPGDLVVDMRNFGTRLRLYRWIRSEISLGTPIIHGTFDVYLDEDRLSFVKSPCAPQDLTERFFLHVEPVETSDLSAVRKPHGSDNLDFDWHGVIHDGRCLAEVRRPAYPIARISTGQFSVTDMKRSWEGTYSP